jgi:hypothetical protein
MVRNMLKILCPYKNIKYLSTKKAGGGGSGQLNIIHLGEIINKWLNNIKKLCEVYAGRVQDT